MYPVSSSAAAGVGAFKKAKTLKVCVSSKLAALGKGRWSNRQHSSRVLLFAVGVFLTQRASVLRLLGTLHTVTGAALSIWHDDMIFIFLQAFYYGECTLSQRIILYYFCYYGLMLFKEKSERT